MLEFRLLGPVEVRAGGDRIALGSAESAKTRCVLAVLLRTPGMLVTTDALTDRVWGEQPPGSAVRYKYIGWLRSALAPHGVSLARQGAGYVLEVTADQVDLHRFRQLIGQARDADEEANVDKASCLLDEALSQWHGVALSGLSGTWAELFRSQLERERRAARVMRARCALKAGTIAQALESLDEWEAEYPTDEEIIGLRMTALYRSGQHTDARACYQRACQRLRDILGVSPGRELVALHQSIQNGSPVTPQHSPAVPVTRQLPPAAPVPRQLPPAVPAFAGRRAELASLDAAMIAGQDGEEGVGTVVISAVSGTAGVGKTALAVYWAHRAAPSYPDGQLYVNLRGFDPCCPALDPGEAVRGFLEALGVPAQRIPAAPPAQTALWRSLVSGKRVLVVLDNARDAEQVRPLLPGSPGCLAIVTSRNDLGGLVAIEGACPLNLDVFTVDEARDLLEGRLGAVRMASEPGAADDIISGCARLPLALVIAAARAAARPGFPLAALATELRGDSVALSNLHGGDTATDVRAVFSWSYRTLSDGAARVFRLLGLHPGPDISTSAGASLCGIIPGLAATVLTELARAHLLAEHAPGRYAFHDLLRAYAAEQAHAQESEDSRRAAIHRVLDHYLHTAETAAQRMSPVRIPIATTPAQPGVTCDEVADAQQALAWFTVERPVLLATIAQAPVGFDTHTWQLASALGEFLDRRGHWQDLKAAQAAALAAAQRQGDRTGEATAYRGLGLAYAGLSQFDDAHAHYLRALDLFTELGSHADQAHTHLSFAWLAGAQGSIGEAIDHYRQSLRHYHAAGLRSGQAKALNSIGWYLAESGDYDQALAHCQQALIIVRELGDLNSQAHTTDTLGYIYRHLGDRQQAIACYRQALDLFHATGDSYGEATCFSYLGDTHDEAGDTDAARQAWERALEILNRLDHPDADRVRAKLTQVSDGYPGSMPYRLIRARSASGVGGASGSSHSRCSSSK
ncbi:MAG TPA: tetratricopeptide repeat protein [Streptosporangiaceae bacterium]